MGTGRGRQLPVRTSWYLNQIMVMGAKMFVSLSLFSSAFCVRVVGLKRLRHMALLWLKVTRYSRCPMHPWCLFLSHYIEQGHLQESILSKTESQNKTKKHLISCIYAGGLSSPKILNSMKQLLILSGLLECHSRLNPVFQIPDIHPNIRHFPGETEVDRRAGQQQLFPWRPPPPWLSTPFPIICN